MRQTQMPRGPNSVFRGAIDFLQWAALSFVAITQLGGIPVESRTMSLVLAGVSPASPEILPEEVKAMCFTRSRWSRSSPG